MNRMIIWILWVGGYYYFFKSAFEKIIKLHITAVRRAEEKEVHFTLQCEWLWKLALKWLQGSSVAGVHALWWPPLHWTGLTRNEWDILEMKALDSQGQDKSHWGICFAVFHYLYEEAFWLCHESNLSRGLCGEEANSCQEPAKLCFPVHSHQGELTS